MSEKDLNIKYICNKTLLEEKDELVPIILEMIQESYKAGLCQSEFDNTMGLIEENKELKSQLELYENGVYYSSENDKIQQENEELKKQLEEWKYHLKCSKEMLEIQGRKGNYDYDEYMLGLYNGMEYIISLFR